MYYNLFNSLVIVIGAIIGSLVGNKIDKKQLDAVLLINNVVILVLGIQGAVQTKNPILMMVSLSIGGFIGEGIDIDQKFIDVGNYLNHKIKLGDGETAQGILTLILVHTVGSMSILGPLNAALKNDGSIIVVKSALDFSLALIYASNFGIGTAVSGLVTLVYQSIIFYLASLIAPVMTEMVIFEIGAIGSVLIMGIAFTLLNIKEMKVGNYLPALFGPIIFQIILNFIN